jgi:hypothetical protein
MMRPNRPLGFLNPLSDLPSYECRAMGSDPQGLTPDNHATARIIFATRSRISPISASVAISGGATTRVSMATRT